MLYLPLKSIIVPMLVSLITTDTPEIGKPSQLDVTVPSAIFNKLELDIKLVFPVLLKLLNSGVLKLVNARKIKINRDRFFIFFQRFNYVFTYICIYARKTTSFH